jgi:hypothetical protein
MKTNPVILSLVSAAVVFCGSAALPLAAQLAVPPVMQAYQPLSEPQLDQLLAPIALYPDPLLAQILPASTLPTQVVLANRYLMSGGDPGAIFQQPWDASVQALAHYPAVLRYLDDNLAWTTEIGQAFLNQPQEVMDSIQRLRLSAQNFGNLVSTPQQQVVWYDGSLDILPSDPNLIYVPVYEPDTIYYQTGCPPGFGAPCIIGAWLNCDFDWHRHHLFCWDRGHQSPGGGWSGRPADRAAWLAQQGTIWRPEDHHDHSGSHWNEHGLNGPAPAAPLPHGGGDRMSWTSGGSHSDSAPRPAPALRPGVGSRSSGGSRFEGDSTPGANHPTAGFHLGNSPTPGSHAIDHGGAVRGESPHEFHASGGGSGQESARPMEHSAPTHTEPTHTEPTHTEPAHTEPAHTEPPASHPAPTPAPAPAATESHSSGSSSHR